MLALAEQDSPGPGLIELIAAHQRDAGGFGERIKDGHHRATVWRRNNVREYDPMTALALRHYRVSAAESGEIVPIALLENFADQAHVAHDAQQRAEAVVLVSHRKFFGRHLNAVMQGHQEHASECR